MYKIILYFVAMTNILVFCSSPKSTSVGTKKPDMVSETIIINIKIKKIDGENVKSVQYLLNSQYNDTLIALINTLITESEPLRIYLDESEMKELFKDHNSTEISFAPPVSADEGALKLTRFLFFTNGKYGNGNVKGQKYFFLAYDDNDEFIQSPFVNYTMDDEFQHLLEIIEARN